MLNQIPDFIKEEVMRQFSERSVSRIELLDFSFTSGGCINESGVLATSLGNYFIKWNDSARYPGMFNAESRGLNKLSDTQTLQVPQVMFACENAPWQFLVLEYIRENTRKKNYWKTLGEQLAMLHRNTDDFFGLDYDNYIGSLQQINTNAASWIDFFIHNRLAMMMKKLEAENRIDQSLVNSMDRLYSRLKDLLPDERPSLLHGDLWSGNVISGPTGNPVVIDPAIYFGNREAEIAFTRLFGGFDEDFYESYQSNYPLISGFEERCDLYNLYPLLVHANLFGQSYLSRISSIVKKYS